MEADHQVPVVIFYLGHRPEKEAFQSLPQLAFVARVKHTNWLVVLVHDLELDLIVKVAWFFWLFCRLVGQGFRWASELDELARIGDKLKAQTLVPLA